MILDINRYKEDYVQTESDFTLFETKASNFSCTSVEIFTCKGLELPWRDNKKDVSRILPGVYNAIKHISPDLGKTIWIKDVPGRSEIVIHVGNFVGNLNPRTGKPDSRGCPVVGEKLRVNPATGIPDLVNSRNIINSLYDIVNDEFIVRINDNF